MEPKQQVALDVKIALGVFIVVFVVYFLTLCPTIYPGPSADAVCDVKGVGITPASEHPIWVILGRLFGVLSSNTARVLNLLSAFFGAATAALLYALLSQFRHTRTAEEEARYQTQPYLGQVAALSGALLVAFSHPFWEGSVLAGSDTLNTFFLVLIVFLMARYVKTSKSRYALAFGLVYGLAITNYPTLFLLAPIFVLFFLFKCRPLLDDPVALVLMFILFGVGLLPALYEPQLYVLRGKDYVVHAKTFGQAFSAFVETYFRSMKQLFLQKNTYKDWIFWLLLPTFLPVVFLMMRRGEYERGSPTATKLTYLVRYLIVSLCAIGGLGYLWGYRVGPVGMAGLDYLRYPRYLGSYVVVGAWFSYIVGYWIIIATGKFKATGTAQEPKRKFRRVEYIVGVVMALALPLAGFIMNYSKSTKRDAKWAEHFALGLLNSSPENAIIIVPVEPFFGSIGAPLRYFQSLDERAPSAKKRTIIDLNAAYFDFYTIKHVETERYLAETVLGRKVAQPRKLFSPENPFAGAYDDILKCELARALKTGENPRPIYGLVNNFFLSPFLIGNNAMNQNYRAEPAGLLYEYRSRLQYRDRPKTIKDNERLWKQLWANLGVTNKNVRRRSPSEAEEHILGEYSKSANDFGVFCQLAGRLDLAEEYYDRALVLSPENSSAIWNMATVATAKDNAKRAEEFNKQYESLIKEQREQEPDFLTKFGVPLDFGLFVSTDSALARQTDPYVKGRRLAVLHLAADIIPQNPGVRERTGDLLLSSRGTLSLMEARGEYLAALERTDPKDTRQTKRLMGKLAIAYVKLGENSEAERFFKKALDPDAPWTQLALMQFYLTTDQKPAEVKRLAASILEKALADEKDRERLAAAKREAAIMMTKVLLKADGTEKAKEFLSQYLTDQPQEVDLLLKLSGEVWNDATLDALTIWLLEQYLNIREDLPLPWLPQLAEVYLRQEQYDALIGMKEPVSAGPNRELASFHYFRAKAYEALGKSTEAAEKYERARSFLPEDSGDLGAAVANDFAWLYFKNDKLHEAERLAEEALANNPMNSLIWDTYGWILYKGGGDFDKAIELVEASHLASPNVAIITYHYGKLLIEKGLTEKGMAMLEGAIESGLQEKEELEDAQQILKNVGQEITESGSEA